MIETEHNKKRLVLGGRRLTETESDLLGKTGGLNSTGCEWSETITSTIILIIKKDEGSATTITTCCGDGPS